MVVLSDVRLYREGLALALARHAPVDVVGVLSPTPDALTGLEGLHPDVALLELAGRASLRLVGPILASSPGIRVVAFAVAELDDEIVACAEAGVAAYVPREGSIDDLVTVIESAARGELVCSPRMAATLFRRLAALAAQRGAALPQRLGLTARERQIVEMVDRGLSNKEIASVLSIEVATVKNHVHSLLEKLHVSRRGEAAALLRGVIAARPSG